MPLAKPAATELPLSLAVAWLFLRDLAFLGRFLRPQRAQLAHRRERRKPRRSEVERIFESDSIFFAMPHSGRVNRDVVRLLERAGELAHFDILDKL